MSICKWCFQEFPKSKSFGAHVVNCHLNPKRAERLQKIANTRTKKRIEVKRNCLFCKNEFTVKGTETQINTGRHRKCCSNVCSRTYAAKFNRKITNEKIAKTLTLEKLCLTCKADATRKAGGTGKYCINHKKKVLIFSEIKSSDTLKRWLIKSRGRKCEICCLFKWQGFQIPIQLDHIDGNPDNNVESNLRLLCPNCHSLTPTFSGKNKGKFPSAKRNILRSDRRKSV